MPEINPAKIISFSSEDQLYPVKNLLKGSSLYQWKCKNTSGIEGYVEFQFEKLTRFTRIEIGNQSSAFIEIKVSRSMDDQDYKVLLGQTSLMSPSESLKFENLNRVKYFKDFNFSTELSQEKWDIVRVILTQPFNKTLQFGLSFIKFFGELDSVIHVDETENNTIDQKIDISKLLNSRNDEEFKPGSLFANRKKADEFSKLKEIKIESESVSHSSSSSIDIIPTDSNTLSEKDKKKQIKQLSSEVTNDENNTKSNEDITLKSDKSIDKLKKLSEKSSLLLTTKRPIQDSGNKLSSQCKRPKLDSIPNENVKAKLTPCSSSLSQSSDHHNSISKKKSLDLSSNNIFKDVIFVLSGYLNPFRNELRDKALSLGAKYRTSWTDDSTHLICAYNNTPKFNEVCGKGIIVSEKWIIQSYNQKKLLNWRDFRLKGATSPPKIINSSKRSYSNSISSVGNDISNYSDIKDAPSTSKDKYSSCDKTENEDNVDSINTLPPLPDIFEGLNFFFYGNFENKDLRFFKRIIVTFGGVIHEYMDSAVRIVITNSSWDHNFDEALESNPGLKFIRSSWLNACDEQNFLVSFDDFEMKKE